VSAISVARILQPRDQQAKEDAMKYRIGALAGTSALSLTLLAGCASNEPVATAQLTAVRQAIDQAQQADAQHYATREINMAREKLEAAQDASEKGNEAQAANLAEQAKLDAEYASAVAQNREAQNAVTTLNDTLDTLRNELNSGSAGTSQQQVSPNAGSGAVPAQPQQGVPSTGAQPDSSSPPDSGALPDSGSTGAGEVGSGEPQ
jgi:hypothetical protein